MCIPPCSPSPPRARRNSAGRFALAALAALAAQGAFALSTDRQQPMTVTSDYSKIKQGSGNAPGTAYLRGHVRIVQGTMKANGDEATIYQHPDGAKNAQGEDVSGSVKRVVLTGKQAHIEQQQDGGGLMTADADKIDYDSDTGVALLIGGVKVVQQGRGTFSGEHMTYNTNTGEMESVDTGTHKPITMTFEPKKKAPAKSDGKDAKPAPPANEDGGKKGGG
jgi:lipopolysaccharide export system protein LptA